MSRIIFNHENVSKCIVGTVGLPGERQFFLQVTSSQGITCVAIEKSQAMALSDRLRLMIKELRRNQLASFDELNILSERDDTTLEFPITEDFRVGVIGISWQQDIQRIVIEAQSIGDESLTELLDEDEALLIEDAPDLLSFKLRIHQAKSFCDRTDALVVAGRQPLSILRVASRPCRSFVSACQWIPSVMLLEEIVTIGELRVEGRFVDASNATLYAITTAGEQEVPVIYKPIAGERPLWDFPDGNLAKRELAAYQLSELLELHLVPFTVIREGPFGPGMVQQWVEIDESVDVVNLAQSEHEDIRKMALFDAIVNNTDRKYGHILPTESGKVFGCDHGVTFHEDPKLRTVLWQFAAQPFTTQENELLKFAQLNAGRSVANLLTSEEIAALIQRIEQLLELGAFPEPSQDWPTIPWPPF